jgi:AraC-like DNA-binding protein
MTSSTSDDRIRHAIRFMESVSAAKPITVAELARSAHLSVSHFAHLFHECTGIAPIQMGVALILDISP